MAWWVAAIGAAAAVGGALTQADIERDAANAEAQNLENQANNILIRADYIAKALDREEDQIIAQQSAAFVKGGASLGFGSTINMMNETSRQVMREIMTVHREARFQAESLRARAKMKREFADDVTQAALISALGGAGLKLSQGSIGSGKKKE